LFFDYFTASVNRLWKQFAQHIQLMIRIKWLFFPIRKNLTANSPDNFGRNLMFRKKRIFPDWALV